MDNISIFQDPTSKHQKFQQVKHLTVGLDDLRGLFQPMIL